MTRFERWLFNTWCRLPRWVRREAPLPVVERMNMLALKAAPEMLNAWARSFDRLSEGLRGAGDAMVEFRRAWLALGFPTPPVSVSVPPSEA